jgi:FMN phosphatase YigB (HAD superfamily)
VQVDHWRFCRRLAHLAGLTPGNVYDGIFDSGLEYNYDTGRLTSEELHRRVEEHFGVALPFSRFAAWWCEIFDPMAEMEALVSGLAGVYPLYLLSNTNTLHFDYIREHYPLLRHFKAFILSYEAGNRKPEPGIYQALIRQTGLSPHNCLYVDDKLPFVTAARGQGLESWQFTHPEAFIRSLQEHGIY